MRWILHTIIYGTNQIKALRKVLISLTTCEAGTHIWHNVGSLSLSPGHELWYSNDYDGDYHFYSGDGGGDGSVDDEDAQWRRNYYGSSDNDDNNVNYDDDDDNDGDDNDDDGDDDWYLHAGQDEAVSNKMCWVANSLASLEAGK